MKETETSLTFKAFAPPCRHGRGEIDDIMVGGADGRTNGRTDGRTEGRADGQIRKVTKCATEPEIGPCELLQLNGM